MTEEQFLKELTEWYREPIDGMKHLTQISFTPYQLLQFIEQLEKNNLIKPDVSRSSFSAKLNLPTIKKPNWKK